LPLCEDRAVEKLAGVVSRACATDEIARLVFNISTPAVNTRTTRDEKKGAAPHASGNSLAARVNIPFASRAAAANGARSILNLKYESFR
jgi:hypothetical protein